MNENDQNNNPMIRINGAKAKEIREKKGLTQLYVATSVGVTTDTISRWENRRYPSVKGENAEKLAEALEVELADILESQAAEDEPSSDDAVIPSPVSALPRLPSRLKRHLMVIFMVSLVVVALQGARYFSQKRVPAVTVTALRTLPAHVPAGQQFPVLVTVEASEEVSFSLLVREALPPGCRVISAVPDFTSADKDSDMLKWVSRLEGKSRIFAYLLSSPEVEENTELLFKGRLLAGRQSSSSPDIGGDLRLRISNFHWADQNSDNRIDDEEVLAVYDLYSEIQGLDIDRDLIDEIWASGGYRWNEQSGRYEVSQ